MIEAILLAFLVAKIKKYKIKPLFKDWTIYPVVVFVLLYIVFQAMIFTGNYSAVQFTNIYKTVYLSSFLILMIRYKQYVSGLIGSGFVVIGTILNNIVIAANGGKMPVFPTLSYWTGYVEYGNFVNADGMHVLGNNSTKLVLLSDIFDLGYGILSIGDILVRVFVFIILFNSIKHSSSISIK